MKRLCPAGSLPMAVSALPHCPLLPHLPLTSHRLVFPTCALLPISYSCPHALPQLSSTSVIRLKGNFCSLSPQGQTLFPTHDLGLVACGTQCLSSSPTSLTCPILTAFPSGPAESDVGRAWALKNHPACTYTRASTRCRLAELGDGLSLSVGVVGSQPCLPPGLGVGENWVTGFAQKVRSEC